jgi:quinol-cytochrome oxidoreductase complex cytochrome b subunit
MLTARGHDRWKSLAAWFDERLALDSIREFIAHKKVPVHSGTIWYTFGGITLFLFVVQVVTGILLLLYYRPTPQDAFESVQFIMTRVNYGWLIRSIHSWAANLMIFSAFIHMFSVVFLHAYRRPREVVWFSGIALLGLALAFGFSGYLLPWNTISFFATKVGTDIPVAIPWIGPVVTRYLRGGSAVGGATLTRFFGFHVALLPGLTTLFLLLHLGLIQKFGISMPLWIEKQPRAPETKPPEIPFFPDFLLRELIAWYGALAVLGSLAALFPWPLGTKANPFAPAPAGIRPEWYFLAPFYTLKLIPGHVLHLEGEFVGLAGFGLLALAWTFLPLWAVDRNGSVRQKLVAAAGVALLTYLAIFSALGYWR